METQTSELVKSIDQDVNGELEQDVAIMKRLQGETLFIVPTTAIFTFFIAAFFGWSVTRRIIQLRLEERVNERTRIARELHDTLLQGVFSASMQLHLAVDHLPADFAARPMFLRPLQILAQSPTLLHYRAGRFDAPLPNLSPADTRTECSTSGPMPQPSSRTKTENDREPYSISTSIAVAPEI